MKQLLSFIAFLLICVSMSGFSQTTEERVDARMRSMEKNNSAYLSVDHDLIPPLGMLIDSALYYSPLLKTKEIDKTIREWELKVAKLQWSDYLETFTEFRYGSIDNVFISPTGTAINNNVSISSRYHIGARINFTIFDIISHKNVIRAGEARIALEDARADELRQLIRQEVIRLWNHLSTYKEIISISADHLEAQKLNINEARKRYLSGEVDIVEYARVKQISSKAHEELVLSKKEYREALYLLYELVGRDDLADWMNPSL